MPAYEHRHVVGFEETSLVGNVYFTNYLLWQGHCRERFLRDHAPEVLEPISRREIAFLTRSCSCDFGATFGFVALDLVIVRMSLAKFRGGRMSLDFEYAHGDRPGVVIARGTQEVHCQARRADSWVPVPFPAALARALLAFAEGEELKTALREALEFHDPRLREAGG